jgi:hypothetical protein
MNTLDRDFKKATHDTTKMIVNGCKAISSFSMRPGLLEFEDYLYSIEEDQIRREILAELAKAKQLLRSRKGWRWEMIKTTNGNPFKLMMLATAWIRNKRHGNRNRTKHKN